MLPSNAAPLFLVSSATPQDGLIVIVVLYKYGAVTSVECTTNLLRVNLTSELFLLIKRT